MQTETLSVKNRTAKNLLIALKEIKVKAEYRKSQGGICYAISGYIIENNNDTHYNNCTISNHCRGLLEDIFLLWPKFSGYITYPICTKETQNYDKCSEIYCNALDQRKSWTRSTKYGALRWELLDWCIAECERMEAEAEARNAIRRTKRKSTESKQKTTN